MPKCGYCGKTVDVLRQLHCHVGGDQYVHDDPNNPELNCWINSMSRTPQPSLQLQQPEGR